MELKRLFDYVIILLECDNKMEKEDNKLFLVAFVGVLVGVLIGILLGVNVWQRKNPGGNISPLPKCEPCKCSIAASTNELDYYFLQKENFKQNMIYSPLSIKYALSMLSEGASGETKAQIDKALNNATLTKYADIESHLSLANALFIKNDYNYVKDEYINNLQYNYGADIKYDSFNNADNINSWISSKTFNMLKKVVDDSDIGPDTVMAIVNALAIDMEWDIQFEKELPNQVFTLENGEKVNTTFLYNNISDFAGENNFKYFKDDDATSIDIKLKEYEGTQLDLMIIMPNGKLDSYISGFNGSKFEEVNNKLNTIAGNGYEELNVYIPKFTYDYSLSLQQDLIDLGITDAFDPTKADFSEMTNAVEGLHVSKAIHKAKVEVSLEGLKAAAATAFMMDKNSAMIIERRVDTVRIDKPFMYIIKDSNSNEVWFVGTLYNFE